MTSPATRTALVTGASSGIGAAFARALAQDGYNVVVVARRADRLNALCEELNTVAGVTAIALPADLSRPEAPAELAAALAERGMRVDLLINNAGIGTHGPFADTPAQADQAMLTLNVTALTAMTKAFLPAMLAHGSGGIINVASSGAFQPIPYFAVYAATKAYVLSFSEALAVEVMDRGVKVVCLCPGPTQSEFSLHAEFKTDMVDRAPMMTSEAVVAEGLAALRAGRVVHVPGFFNAVGAFSTRLAPRALVSRLSGMIFKPNR